MSHPSVNYLRQFAPLAAQLSDEYGIPAEVILTQGAVESQWGKKHPGNNYFGFRVPGRLAYKKYAAAADSFRDYAREIATTSRYRSALDAGSSEGILAEIAKRGYSERGWQAYYRFAAQLLGTVRKYSAVAGVASLVPEA